MSGPTQSASDLYRSMRERVYGLALQMLGDPGEAEDAVQATFLQVFRYLPRFRGEASVETWVYRIAIRESGLRAKKRGAGPRPMPAAEPAARTGVDRDEADRALAALQGLSEEHRTVLSLLLLREIPVRQVAEILRVAEGTVWSRAHAARQKLREALERETITPAGGR